MDTEEILGLSEKSDITENTNSIGCLIEMEKIENSPFNVVKVNERYIGVLGNHRITIDDYDSKEECVKVTTEISWDRIVQVLWAINEKFNKKGE